MQLGDLKWIFNSAELDHFHVALARKVTVHIEHVGDTTAHTRSKVTTGRAQDHNATTRHILTAVIADAFNNSVRARITHGETFGGNTGKVAMTACSTIQACVTHDDVLLRHERRRLGRIDNETPTRQTLTDIVIRITFEFECDTWRQEGATRLAGTTAGFDVNSVTRQALLAKQL